MNLLLILIFAMTFSSNNKEIQEYADSQINIKITQGKNWLHKFPLFMGIKINNPTQIAIWAEDLDGNYLTSIYVTQKTATESWIANKGDRRASSLPVWAHKRGVKSLDGLYLPTKEEPLTDGITGATPKGDLNLKLTDNKDIDLALLKKLTRFVVYIEVNHSTDWNQYYPKEAKVGDKNYTGGKGGSGQPALIYSTIVDFSDKNREFSAPLIGHSSPDGSNGYIYPDLTKITSALEIVEKIVITIN
jgi:hypothetical protein